MINWGVRIRCGRPVKNGQPCKARRMGLPVILSPADDGYLPPACPHHATDDERQAHALVLERAAAHSDAFLRSLPVACTSWEIPEAVRQAVAAASDERALLLVLGRWQGDRCGVCGGSEADMLDHDHSTGLVRGCLCRGCNGQEPGGSDGDRFDRYRSTNPASLLGVSIRYIGPFM